MAKKQNNSIVSFRTQFNVKGEKQFAQTFSKHRPKRKLIKHKDGDIELKLLVDKQTGEVETDNVYEKVQQEKHRCVVLTEQGAKLGGQLIDLKKLPEKGKYGDFRNVPKSTEELLEFGDRIKNAAKYIDMETGAIKPQYIVKEKPVADAKPESPKPDSKPESKEKK